VTSTGCKAQTAVSQTVNTSTFETAMLHNIRQLDTASAASTLITLGNNFERIGNAEQKKWEPFYYAAYCYTVMAFMSPDKTKIDWLADKAEAYLQKAEAIEKNNSEISCLFAMINSCRILVDPIARFQAKGKEVQMFLDKAKQENVHNPRIYLLQGRMQIRTPEAFGGGKKPAKESIDLTIEKFKNFKPKNAIAPNWGEKQAISLLNQINAIK
ncbi:MAG: hypothetical protein ABR503_16300, partial [Chitinophagaceae bacterium]